MPKFHGEDLEKFAQQFLRWLRLTGLDKATDSVKKDWWVEATHGKSVKATVERVAETTRDFPSFITKLEEIFPKLETDTSIRGKLQDLPSLPREPSPQQVMELIGEMDYLFKKMSPHSISQQLN